MCGTKAGERWFRYFPSGKVISHLCKRIFFRGSSIFRSQRTKFLVFSSLFQTLFFYKYIILHQLWMNVSWIEWNVPLKTPSFSLGGPHPSKGKHTKKKWTASFRERVFQWKPFKNGMLQRIKSVSMSSSSSSFCSLHSSMGIRWQHIGRFQIDNPFLENFLAPIVQ